MAEPTVVQVFGTGAARLASGATTPEAGLFIPDTALTAAGLDSPPTATAEGHLVAINLGAQSYLTQANFDSNIDQSIVVEKGFSSFVTRTDGEQYRTDQLTLTKAKIDNGGVINPNDY
ncbi:hypothetical protein [Anabaena sp. CCY 0017]|uniref:hypothetical protein n=1 Tax=Anabaena sp. CCY 0017 TaxID=3103866 RepID=UPI0039C60E9E